MISVSGIDLLFKLLETDPDKRPDAKEAIKHQWFINFTSKPNHKKGASKHNKLTTILECTENLSDFESNFLSKNIIIKINKTSLITLNVFW